VVCSNVQQSLYGTQCRNYGRLEVLNEGWTSSSQRKPPEPNLVTVMCSGAEAIYFRRYLSTGTAILRSRGTFGDWVLKLNRQALPRGETRGHTHFYSYSVQAGKSTSRQSSGTKSMARVFENQSENHLDQENFQWSCPSCSTQQQKSSRAIQQETVQNLPVILTYARSSPFLFYLCYFMSCHLGSGYSDHNIVLCKVEREQIIL
jgi:hypothetical protein